MNTLLTQPTIKEANRWFGIGLCSVALGVSSLFLATGSALATTIFDFDELTNGDGTVIAHVSNNKLATSGDFYINDFDGKKAGNGGNEWRFGEFNLSGTNWSDYMIKSAKLTLTLNAKNNGVKNDKIFLGSVFNFTDYILTDEVGIASLFVGGKKPTYGLDLPVLGEETMVMVDLLTYISKSKFKNLLQGEDTGYIWLKYSDDAVLSYAKLEVSAVQNPEPASLILLGTGLVGLAAWRYRKERKA